MKSDAKRDRLDCLTMYREMQRAVPGLDAMYRIAHALIAGHETVAPRVLIVGAGGGREIEELRGSPAIGSITAIDPSARNLDTAKTVAIGVPKVEFIVGTVEDLPGGATFDVITSLLVMHHLADNGAKLRYLQSLRERLAPGAPLIHADLCFDDEAEFDRLVPTFKAHAERLGVSAEAVRLELDAVPKMQVTSAQRMGELFAEAGLFDPQEVFRTLWYRCWISTAARP